MPQYDYLKNQIEEIGRFLSLLLSEFIKLKSTGKNQEAIHLIEKGLKKEYDTSLDNLLQSTPDEIIEALGATEAQNFLHLEQMGKIFFHLSDAEENAKRKYRMLLQAKTIYEYVLQKDPVFYLEREKALLRIDKQLKNFTDYS
jgi:hypothetical protein